MLCIIQYIIVIIIIFEAQKISELFPSHPTRPQVPGKVKLGNAMALVKYVITLSTHFCSLSLQPSLVASQLTFT